MILRGMGFATVSGACGVGAASDAAVLDAERVGGSNRTICFSKAPEEPDPCSPQPMARSRRRAATQDETNHRAKRDMAVTSRRGNLLVLHRHSDRSNASFLHAGYTEAWPKKIPSGRRRW